VATQIQSDILERRREQALPKLTARQIARLIFRRRAFRAFAVCDVRAGSVKQVASAVGEGPICIQFVHRVLLDIAVSLQRSA
jgi:hypothetical protein